MGRDESEKSCECKCEKVHPGFDGCHLVGATMVDIKTPAPGPPVIAILCKPCIGVATLLHPKWTFNVHPIPGGRA